MHISRSKWRSRNGKVYESIYLRESFREKGKVKKRQIANLTHCSQEDIQAIELALKHKNNLAVLGSLKDVEIKQGLSAGAVWAVYHVAKKLGIELALGDSFEGKLALWQVIARIIEQGSRLSAVRLAKTHTACDILGIEKSFNEDHLYANLSWLCQKQETIERKLFKIRNRVGTPGLFLYDVTSSYLEGECNELGDYGYNRDKKRGKKQIVIGLLCDEKGDPISTEVFKGNTQDLSTFASQVRKAKEVFNCKHITFVGDRGMIKSKQIDSLKEFDFHYITAISKSQIKTLLNNNVIQIEFFEEEVCEVEYEGERYILKRNPQRAKELDQNRIAKKEKIKSLVEQKNQYLCHHKRATLKAAIKEIREKINKLKVSDWLKIDDEERQITLIEDSEALADKKLLDGCYVIKTDLSKETADKDTVHDRYKDLAQVEKAFRDCKTVNLEVRPVYLQMEDHTRAHVLIVMLAYMVIKKLREEWREFDVTVEEGINVLKNICSMVMKTKKEGTCLQIAKPNDLSLKLLNAIDVVIPTTLPSTGINVDTRKKLSERRKDT